MWTEVPVKHPLILVTTTSLHLHVRVSLDNYSVVDVSVENGDGRVLRRNTTRRRDGGGIDGVNERLDDGMVGSVELGGEGVSTPALTLVGVITGCK